MTAFREPVVVNQLGIGLLGPAARRRVDLLRECTHGGGERHAFRREEGQLAFPVETRRRERGVGQPVERDVVDDVFLGQTLGLSVEDAGDQVVAACIVVEHPGCEAHG